MMNPAPWPQTSTESGVTGPLQEAISRLTQHLAAALTPELAEALAVVHGDATTSESLRTWLEGASVDLIAQLLRADTALFHLLNQAEKGEIVRVNRERSVASDPDKGRPESVMDAVGKMKEMGVTAEQFERLADRIDIRPTITAHPTEARRRSILYRQQAIGAALTRLHQGQLPPSETEDLEASLARDIHLLHLTDEVRPRRLTVADEVEYGLYFLQHTVWDTIPRISKDLRRAASRHFGIQIKAAAPVRFRSWIGSDRDGNPFVTPETTINTFMRQRQAALQAFLKELRVVRRVLSVSETQTPTPSVLLASLEKDAREVRLPGVVLEQFEREPYRLKLSYMMARVHSLLEVDKGVQGADIVSSGYSGAGLVRDIQVLQEALTESGLAEAATTGPLQELLDRAQVFGFHFAALDVRQHSQVHESAVSDLLQRAGVTDSYSDLSEEDRQRVLSEELDNPRPLLAPGAVVDETSRMVLDTFRAIQTIIKTDQDAFGTFVVSMTHTVSDLLEVMLLAKEVGLARVGPGGFECPLDISPLFETIQDLADSGEFMESLFAHPAYRSHLEHRGRFQELMLGYSDSNKDGGFWMANWALHNAQKTLGDVCRSAGYDFRLFHGRGGTVGRGGGRANRAISAMPGSCRNGRIRFTEQGEVISFRYAQPDIAHRHLEQIVGATLSTSTESVEPVVYPARWLAAMNLIASEAMSAYRALIDHPDFWSWYTSITPIEHISRLPIASRPVSRKAAGEVDFEGLRAIPWVFAWTQTRYTVPGWYGTGAGLGKALEADPEILRDMYRDWPFFTAVMDAVQLEMARARPEVSEQYASQSEDRSFHRRVMEDLDRAHKSVLAITGQDELLDHSRAVQRSIAYRNPLTDPINAMQLELMHRYRAETNDEQKSRLRELLYLSINGIAAAMQSTG